MRAPRTLCDVIAVRLLTIAVLSPIVRPLSSVFCRLITPYISPFWYKNDAQLRHPRGTACNASCAAMVTQFFYARFGLVFRDRAELCASCTRWCGDTRGLCAQQWFAWAMNALGCRSSGTARVVRGFHQH